MKILVSCIRFLISSFLLLVSSPSVFAGNNVTITCSAADECSHPSPVPLFDENNITPGFIASPAPILTVINERSQDECYLNFSAGNLTGSSSLTSKISVSIVGQSTVYYAGNLSDLLNGNNHTLGVIPPSSTRQYIWTPSFDQAAGNDYQNLTAKFDLDFNFSCSPPPPPTPTPTPTSIIQDLGSNPPGSVLGAASAPTCNDTPPSGPPILVSALPDANSVTLTWTAAPAPVSYYLIAYGTSPGSYTYGNPNIGGPGATSYVVGNLSASQTYYFVIRAGNGCAPGPFSAEISATPFGIVLPPGEIPPGFQPGVLGETEVVPSVTSAPSPGQIAGSVDCRRNLIPFVISLIIFIFSLFLYIKNHQRRFLFFILLGIIGIIIFWPRCFLKFFIF